MRADAVGLPDMPATCSVAVKMLKGKMYALTLFSRSRPWIIKWMKPTQLKLFL